MTRLQQNFCFTAFLTAFFAAVFFTARLTARLAAGLAAGFDASSKDALAVTDGLISSSELMG